MLVHKTEDLRRGSKTDKPSYIRDGSAGTASETPSLGIEIALTIRSLPHRYA